MATPPLRGRASEREALDRLIAGAREGRSGVLVIRGSAGVGKTALLRYAAGQATAFRVVEIAGVESERELPFAGLQQFCRPLLDRLDALAQPQRDALDVAFGLASGAAPDRFLVGLATLTLVAAYAEEQPVLSLVDDLQWLDEASAQVLGFVARRLHAESVAIVFGVRGPGDPRGLPELHLEGLEPRDAAALLSSVVAGRLDERVRDRLIAETGGNPLALLELPRGMSAAELAGGFALPGPLAPRGIEDAVRQRRIDPLPADTRRLLQLAAADPVGEPLLVWRAAERLGIDPAAAAAAVDAGVLDLGAQVRFNHPCMRSATYRSASPDERRALHAALADVTDAQLDPDRRAWHRAQATHGPDEQVAEELERSAGRALSRGGVAAAAAFLETAATLTPDPARRAGRLLAAAQAKRNAGALDEALRLLAAVDGDAAEIERLRGEIAFDQRRVVEATQLLTSAARRLETVDAEVARTTHLKAIGAAMWAGSGLPEAAAAARAAPPAPDPPRPEDLVLDALATRVTDGYATAAPKLRQALDVVLTLEVAGDVGRWLWLTGSRAGAMTALELWDADAWHGLATRHVQVAREMGALVVLQFALQFVARSHLLGGDLGAAAEAIAEEYAIAEATGSSPVAYADMTLAAWRGQEARAIELIERQVAQSNTRGLGRMTHFASYTAAVLNNGIGRYDAALEAAQRAFEREQIGYMVFVIPELAEAASRIGEPAVLETAQAWMAERTAHTTSDWALGMEARVRALASGDERCFRESVERARPHAPAPGGGPRAAALRRMAPARGPAGRRSRAAARRARRLPGGRRGRLRRARASRAAGDRREGAQASRRHARRADAAGAAHRAAGPGGDDEPADRRGAVPQPPHGGVALEEGVHEARDHFAPRAARRAADRSWPRCNAWARRATNPP